MLASFSGVWHERLWKSLPFALASAAFLVTAVAAGLTAQAQGTHLWSQSRLEEFEKGTPQGVAVGNDGVLRAGPVASEMLTTPSTFIWSVASAANAGKDGPFYLATGSPASVLRVTLAEMGAKSPWKQETLFTSKALAIQVVKLGPDGMLYAATMPEGKVYRLKPDAPKPLDEASAEVVFDLGKEEAAAKASEGETAADGKKAESRPHYIWDMSFDQAGRLYVATGGPGAVYRIDVKAAKPEAKLFFATDEAHLRVLAWDKSGNLLAGSDGSGLVYRITPNGDASGKGYVLFSAPRREITALAVAADGTIYAACVGDKSKNPLPQLPVQAGAAGISISFANPGSVQAANASQSLPDGSEVYALKPDQAPRKVWSDKDDVVYQLAAAPDGGVMALSGNRGRLFAIHADGSYSDFAHLDAQQAVALEPLAGGWMIGTANTGKLYRLDGWFGSAPAPVSTANKMQRGYASYPAAAHAYASDLLDAGAISRWGRIEVDPASHGYAISTRSGNVEQPARKAKDWGWSDWQPLADGKIASPVGRYLQWKVVLEDGGEVSGVGVNYLPVNSAPAVDDIVVVPGARYVAQPGNLGQPASISIGFPAAQGGAASFDGNAANGAGPIQALKDRAAVTARWAAHDDDGDNLKYDLYMRGDDEHVWRPLKGDLTDKVLSFDGSALPDGGYQLKVVASDQPSHAPGEALTGELISARFELDTTPPLITDLKVASECGNRPCPGKTGLPVSFAAKDAASVIDHAEYSLDAGPWQYVEPVGKLSDSKEEHYSFAIPFPGQSDSADKGGKLTLGPNAEHLVTVRVYDRHDNMAVAKLVVLAASGGK